MKYQKVSDLPLPSENLVYYISCRWCLLLYTFVKVEERSLKSRFIEHLRSIRNNTPGFSVAQHFNSTDHSISDVQVRGVALCSGSNFQRKQRVWLILQLGTVQLKGLNINFSFIWIWTLYTSCACYYAHVCLDRFYDVYDIAYYCTTVFFSHRSKKGHKPEMFVFLKTSDTLIFLYRASPYQLFCKWLIHDRIRKSTRFCMCSDGTGSQR